MLSGLWKHRTAAHSCVNSQRQKPRAQLNCDFGFSSKEVTSQGQKLPPWIFSVILSINVNLLCASRCAKQKWKRTWSCFCSGDRSENSYIDLWITQPFPRAPFPSRESRLCEKWCTGLCRAPHGGLGSNRLLSHRSCVCHHEPRPLARSWGEALSDRRGTSEDAANVQSHRGPQSTWLFLWFHDRSNSLPVLETMLTFFFFFFEGKKKKPKRGLNIFAGEHFNEMEALAFLADAGWENSLIAAFQDQLATLNKSLSYWNCSKMTATWPCFAFLVIQFDLLTT